MPLAPKMDELQAPLSSCFSSAGIICIIETWLKDRILDSIVNLTGFFIIQKDRHKNSHGGVCPYINDGIEFKWLTEIESDHHEVLWVEIKPKRLPRKINKLICRVLYRPPLSNDKHMKCYLFSSLQKIESNHPNCGIVLAGDFNQLNIANICRHYGLKQVVKFLTRQEATLDLVLTNIREFYSETERFP